MRIIREPLVHFLVLGALVYVAANRGESARYEIDAGPEQRARLARTYLEQYGAAPTQPQLDRAVEEYVRNEILYREGLAMGLERDDEIVRRRVVQKIEFVNEDLDAPAEPPAAGIARFFAQHRDRYDSEPTVSFEQAFFSADRGGSDVARTRAEAGPVGGDAFAEGSEFRALTPTGANSLFGESQLSAALFNSPVGQWQGPYQSAYGWHVVRITDRRPARHAELEEVRARVQSDYIADVRQRANTEAFRKIATKYRVVTVGPSSTLAGPTGPVTRSPVAGPNAPAAGSRTAGPNAPAAGSRTAGPNAPAAGSSAAGPIGTAAGSSAAGTAGPVANPTAKAATPTTVPSS